MLIPRTEEIYEFQRPTGQEHVVDASDLQPNAATTGPDLGIISSFVPPSTIYYSAQMGQSTRDSIR